MSDLLQAVIEIDSSWHPLVGGNPPVWASGWGEDQYGVWVEFTFFEVVQRMRWIPPGQFMMGSPSDEPGHSVLMNEGPQHPVIISKGYWLFDTQVTQALWLAVMGDNPSRFQSPDRPVEQVSWDDCQQFLQTINAAIPELNLTLPSEAQWEMACRAGELRAIYTGDLGIVGDANAPVLDAIAWYGGNSGKDFDLDEGHEISYLREPDVEKPEKKGGNAINIRIFNRLLDFAWAI